MWIRSPRRGSFPSAASLRKSGLRDLDSFFVEHFDRHVEGLQLRADFGTVANNDNGQVVSIDQTACQGVQSLPVRFA